jgi:HK97 family phage portal protein
MFSMLAQMIRNALANDPAGDGMSADKAVTYAAVKFCVDKISSHIGQLPLNLHKITRDRNEKDIKHAGYRLLRIRPNAYQTPYQFKRQLMYHALLWGNARSYIWRSPFGVELIPLMPDRCDTFMAEGEKVHIYLVNRDERLELADDIQRRIQEAKRDNRKPDVIVLPDSEVVHWHGLGFDGIKGKSVIEMARTSFANGLGQVNIQRNQQKKGYAGGLMLQAPPGAFRRKEDAEEFLEYFRKHNTGENGEVVGMLREGITANVMAMKNTDAQFIETVKAGKEDVMLWFSMPTMPGDSDSVSYNSLEQKNLTYRIDCLGPWMTQIEEECEAKLLTEAEVRNGYYFKFNDGAILRTDKQTTSQVASTLIAARVINPNEAREWFDMNPYEGGETFENPAVSPGTPGTQEESDSEEIDPPAMEGTQNSAVLNTLTHMIGVESRRVIDSCKSPNFVDKIDRFYTKWVQTLADKLESIGLDRDLATEHCHESKDQLMSAADSVTTKEDLAKVVTALVADWTSRAHGIIEEASVKTC